MMPILNFPLTNACQGYQWTSLHQPLPLQQRGYPRHLVHIQIQQTNCTPTTNNKSTITKCREIPSTKTAPFLILSNTIHTAFMAHHPKVVRQRGNHLHWGTLCRNLLGTQRATIRQLQVIILLWVHLKSPQCPLPYLLHQKSFPLTNIREKQSLIWYRTSRGILRDDYSTCQHNAPKLINSSINNWPFRLHNNHSLHKCQLHQNPTLHLETLHPMDHLLFSHNSRFQTRFLTRQETTLIIICNMYANRESWRRLRSNCSHIQQLQWKPPLRTRHLIILFKRVSSRWRQSWVEWLNSITSWMRLSRSNWRKNTYCTH